MIEEEGRQIGLQPRDGCSAVIFRRPVRILIMLLVQL